MINWCQTFTYFQLLITKAVRCASLLGTAYAEDILDSANHHISKTLQ